MNAPHFPRPNGVLESILYAEDLNSAALFYGDLVGLELVSAEPGRHLFFRIGSGMLLVFNPVQTREATVHVGSETIPRHGAQGPGHIAFAANLNELDSIKSQLSDAGFPTEADIRWPGGGRSVYVRDPAGNSIEFATRSLWFGETTDAAGDTTPEH